MNPGPLINTGVGVLRDFTYLYDDIGGFVGYTAVPNSAWGATVAPVSP